MLRLLLDIHIPADVVREVAVHRPACAIESLRDWRTGALRHASDADILTAASEEGKVVVTYDLKTVAALLRLWGVLGKTHGGVIFVDEKTIRQDDVGRLVRSLVSLWDARGHEEWTDVVHYLERPLPLGR